MAGYEPTSADIRAATRALEGATKALNRLADVLENKAGQTVKAFVDYQDHETTR